MKVISMVDPFRCRMWALHDRLETDITEESCKAEIDSFLKHGQLIPVLGRSLKGDPEHDVELIYGSRRLLAARNLNRPLAVELRDMPDTEAIIAMDMENRLRREISPVERGRCYARWLRAGHFDSQEDLARALNMSASQVSRLLRLASLPACIVNAFQSPLEIREKWGLELVEACADPVAASAVAKEAQVLGAVSPRPASNVVFRRLIDKAMRNRRAARHANDELVADTGDRPLLRLRRQSKSVALLLPTDKVSLECLQRIKEALTEILCDVTARDAGRKRVS